MDNAFVRFISSLTLASWLRVLLTIVLTTSSVLLAYPGETGYQLVLGCNIVTIGGTFFLEYKQFMKRRK